MRYIFTLCMCLLIGNSALWGAIVDMRFQNPVVNGSTFTIDVQVQAATVDLLIGSGTVFFEYNQAAINAPTAVGDCFSENMICDGGSMSNYESMFRYLEINTPAQANYNFLLTMSEAACPDVTDDIWLKVATLTFQVVDPTAPMNLQFDLDHSMLNTDNDGLESHAFGTTNDFNLSVNDVIDQTIDRPVSVKAYLQGALSNNGGGTLMRDDLRMANFIPTSEPYSALSGFDIIGITPNYSMNAGVLNTTGNDAIVDWIYIDLRDSNDPRNIILSQAALLQRDGDIVGMDGVNPPTFKIFHDVYYVSIRHRNHLGVMTAQALDVDDTFIDFSATNTATWGTDALNNVGGIMTLWAGNSNGDDQVILQGISNDPNSIFFKVLTDPSNTNNTGNFILSAYDQNDLNLDGQTIFQGLDNEINLIFFNVLFFPQNTSQLAVQIIKEQLP